MSQQQSHSSSTYSSYSYSSSSTSNINGQASGQRSVHSSFTDPSGTTVNTMSQQLGQPAVQETRRFDSQGRELLEGGGAGTANRRIEDVSDDAQAQRDREYEERIEEEYAKREGGA